MNKDLKNLFMAILLSTLVVIAWQYFYENPRKVALEKQQEYVNSLKEKHKEEQIANVKKHIDSSKDIAEEENARIEIKTEKLVGSISLKGLRFDDLQLTSYHTDLDKNSPLVRLLSKDGIGAYFAEFGWVKDNDKESYSVPNKNSIWRCDGDKLIANHPLKCTWEKSEIIFETVISLDENYMFTFEQSVKNNSKESISLSNYARIFKAKAEPKQFAILHEGAIGVFKGVLKESTYEDLSKEKQDIYHNTPGSWLGLTNKYWLTALIPDSKVPSKTHFIATKVAEDRDVYNVNFVTDELHLASGEKTKLKQLFFAGAKEEKLLELYAIANNIELFDRAIDYGIFYFITKPLLWLISYFYSIIGNFGIAIILVTLTLKILMFPLANKSFKSMNRMKEIQPKIEKIKQKYSEDKIKFNQEIMELYKKEKINPAAGCLPLLVQIPLFFSLYKVIFISIEMRHAPFYGWIKDLSAPDPTSIWNLFGLLPWGNMGNFDIGIWPLIMAFTMYLQQKLSPQPTDEIQANVMKFMPLVLLVMLYSLPSGLMIYWSFSNILSIIQQYLISKPRKKI